jgi:Na+-translocating ferredoxin:NAD+ oxidoreductase RnfD subunit
VVNATTNGTSTSTPAWLQGDQTLQAQIFSAKAAGYGGFILLLYFLLAGIYCMCYMPIKKVSQTRLQLMHVCMTMLGATASATPQDPALQDGLVVKCCHAKHIVVHGQLMCGTDTWIGSM